MIRLAAATTLIPALIAICTGCRDAAPAPPAQGEVLSMDQVNALLRVDKENRTEHCLKILDRVLVRDGAYQEQIGTFRASGQCQDGLKVGRWTEVVAAGAPFGDVTTEKNYVLGRLHGPYESKRANAHTANVRGQYSKGVREGPWIEGFLGNERGEYRDDERHGPWEIADPRHADQVDRVTYERGLKNGPAKEWLGNPEFGWQEGEYRLDKREGRWIEFERDGHQRTAVYYEDGMEVRRQDLRIPLS